MGEQWALWCSEEAAALLPGALFLSPTPVSVVFPTFKHSLSALLSSLYPGAVRRGS